MANLKDTLITAIASVVGMFVTGGFGYLVAKGNNKKDTTINDRQLLSEDERAFRSELKEMMNTYQDQVKELTDEVARLTMSNLGLERRVQQLTYQNESLTNQVHELTMANNELRDDLRNR